MSGLTSVSRPRPSTAPVVGTLPLYTITDHGNTAMKVVVRIRPESDAESASRAPAVARALDGHVLVFDPQPENIPSFHPLNPFKKRGPFLGRRHKDLRFAFDRVFDDTSTQRQVFEESTKNIVESVLDGVNCSVFAYGATGAGKTHTMLGSNNSPGVIFHTMMELYQCITRLRDDKIFEVAVSYCEVYNESIRDLLGDDSVDGGSLELREDLSNRLTVSNLSKHQPQTADEILSMLEEGNRNRTQHPTDANATSSRSHAVFQVYVHQKPRTATITTQMTTAKLSLIDLAGSERATVTTNRGERLREGANINKSLLALGNCINALAENKSKSVHVPYRNSKLTRLLKDSLGGNCRTVMIANISPSSLTYEDTYNTLKYADRAKQIKTKVVRNVVNVEFHISRYRAIVQEQQKEIAELKAKLEVKTPAREKAAAASDVTESNRLQDLVRGVYGERQRLRKHMVDLDTQERETLLRICRKERDLHRIATLTGNEAKKAKLAAKVSSLQQQIVETERQKQMVHEYLYSNNEAVSRVQREVHTATANAPALHDLMKEVVERRKCETENVHHWRQTKHLLRYIKAQEREIGKTERILLLALEVARKQHTLLRSHNALTPTVRELFTSLVNTAEGEKGVAWADLNAPSVVGDRDTPIVKGRRLENSGLSVSQKALFDTFLVHASPARRLSLDKHSPATATVPVSGILSNAGGGPRSTGSSTTTTTTTTGIVRRGSDTSASAVDSGVGGALRASERSNSDASSSVASSVLSSRLSSIPDKPRMPTPIDDLSSSCSSNNSLYDTRLNTVINSYHQKPASPGVARAGRYAKLPGSRSGTPTAAAAAAYDSPEVTPCGTPEPYLTPLPSLHKLTLTRQNSERYLTTPALHPPSSWTALQSHVPCSASGTYTTAVHSRALRSSSSGEEDYSSRNRKTEELVQRSPAFTPQRHPHSALLPPSHPIPHSSRSNTYPSSDYMDLISRATQLQAAPIPPPRPPRTTRQLYPSTTTINGRSATTTVAASAAPTPLPRVPRSIASSPYASRWIPSTSSSYTNCCSTQAPNTPNSTYTSSRSTTQPASYSRGSGFEDNFVAPPATSNSPGSCTRPRLGNMGHISLTSPTGGSGEDSRECGSASESSKDTEATLSQESGVSSHSSSSTVKSMEQRQLKARYPLGNAPVVTVETHSTVVSVLPHSHPSSSSQVSVDVNHTHNNSISGGAPPLTRGAPPLTRSRPPAFAHPPNNSTRQQPKAGHNTHHHSTSTCVVSTATKRSTKSPSLFTEHDQSRPENAPETGSKRVLDKARSNSSDSENLKTDETAKRDSPMNSTFTVEPSKPGLGKSTSVTTGGEQDSGGVRRGKVSTPPIGHREEGSSGFKPVPVALKVLYHNVNSPHALDDRSREGTTAESVKSRKTRGVPNYLQLTKAAASKRVPKLQNKENGNTAAAKKYGLGRTTRPSPLPQSVW